LSPLAESQSVISYNNHKHVSSSCSSFTWDQNLFKEQQRNFFLPHQNFFQTNTTTHYHLQINMTSYS